MAAAELLKVTHSIDDRVKGVEGKVEDVRSDVHDVGNKVQGVDHRVQSIDGNIKHVSNKIQGVDDQLSQVNRPSFLKILSPRFKHSYVFAGTQLRENLLRWLSPPDPSTNHNIACDAHHNGTAQWFFQGNIFNQWKSTGSFLWIHGKRVLLLTITKY